MSYSIHFRKKVLAKLEEGNSIRDVAAQFEIDKNTILSWKKCVDIKRTRPRKPSKIDDQALKDDVENILMIISLSAQRVSTAPSQG